MAQFPFVASGRRRRRARQKRLLQGRRGQDWFSGRPPGRKRRVVDLRWVVTRMVQPLSYRTTPVVNPTVLPVCVDVVAVRSESAPTSQNAKVGASDDGTSVGPIAVAPTSASQATAYGTVLGMLRGWDMTDHATR